MKTSAWSSGLLAGDVVSKAVALAVGVPVAVLLLVALAVAVASPVADTPLLLGARTGRSHNGARLEAACNR